MSTGLNKVFLMGRLTRDVELRYMPSGVAFAEFGLVVNRSYVNPDGERVDDVCFVDIIAWDGLAEICGEWMSKGSTVLLEGRLQYRSWEAEDGTKRSKLEVVAQNVQFLDGKHSREGMDDNLPF